MRNFVTKARIALRRNLSMANLLDAAVEHYGDRVLAIVEELPPYPLFAGNTVTYRDFAAAVNRIGNALRDLGIRRCDRIMVYKTNYLDTLAILYATFRLGAIAVPVNPKLSAEVAAGIAAQAKPVAIFTDRLQIERTGLRRDQFGGVAHWISADRPEETPSGFLSLGELSAKQSAELEPVYLPPDAIVTLLHTSGTTGFPKLVMQSNSGLIRQGSLGALFAPVGPKDLVIATLPWVHVLALGSSVVTMISGLRAYCMVDYDTRKVLDAIEQYRATIFVGYPTMFTWMSEELRRKSYNLDSMRYWHVGADAMHAVHIEEFSRYGAFLRLFGRRLISSVVTPGFGMSELGGAVMMPIWFSFSRVIPRCMGRPNPRLAQIKVGDELGRPVARGQAGYLWVKAHGMLRGYWNRHESYVSQISNGFFRTGDLVRQDNRGRLFFLDRETDVIRTASGRIYSLEVEEIFLRHPAVAEVAVVGVSGPDGIDRPVAVGYLKEGMSARPADLLGWAREQMPVDWVPVDFVLVSREEIPLGPTLKVQKYKLRERFRIHDSEGSVTRADAV